MTFADADGIEAEANGTGAPSASWRSGSRKKPNLADHLQLALAETKDPQLQGVLQAQINRIAAEQEDKDTAATTTAETMKISDGVWRAAVNRHSQLVNNVI